MKSNERKWVDKVNNNQMTEEEALNKLDTLYTKHKNGINFGTAEKEMLNNIKAVFTKESEIRGKSETSRGLEANLKIEDYEKSNMRPLSR